MVSAFTHYWTTDIWEQYWGISGSGSPLCHTSGELFGTRGVRDGDLLYVVTVLNNDILLIGKMRIARVCDHHEAAASTVIPPGTVGEFRFIRDE